MRVLSSSQYKYTTIFAEIQIPLTFRNTLAKVKMRRFAAASLWRVLYYEEAMAGSTVLAPVGMPEDGIPIDFVINLELLHKVDTTPHHFDLSSYL